MMKERPILFSSPMVRAILDGSKTQTRRVLNRNKLYNGFAFDDPRIARACPYGQPGDQLWVRETWREENRIVDPASTLIHYFADDTELWKEGIILPFDWSGQKKKRPSIFMPRAASCITLEIVSVGVERAQDISETDALAEGVRRFEYTAGELSPFAPMSRQRVAQTEAVAYGTQQLALGVMSSTARDAFRRLWDAINDKRGYTWASSPWVWVVEFKRLEASNV